MAKLVNSFALLDDEEDDDVDILVKSIVKKFDASLMHAHNDTHSAQFAVCGIILVQNENGGKKGGRGRGRRNGKGGNDDVQDGDGGDAHRRNYSRDSYGSDDATKDEGRWRPDVNEATAGDKIHIENDDAGWQVVSKSRRKGYANRGRPFGDEQRNHRNKNWSYNDERRGYGEQAQYNVAANGQRRYRHGNQSYGGDRRGNMEQAQGNGATGGDRRYRNGRRSYAGERRGYGEEAQANGAADGQRRYRYGRQSYDSERRGCEDQVQDIDVNAEKLIWKTGVTEDNRGEERLYRNGNRNYSGKRGYARRRGRGRLEYQRTGSSELENGNADEGHDVKAGLVNGSGGDAESVLEASKVAELEEQKTFEVIGDIRYPKEATEEQKKKDASELKKKPSEELKLKKKQEEMKEASLMTLDQYGKLLIEKKQALESLKTEARRVYIDKELEGMRLVKKKPDGSNDIWKSSKDKLKMKDSLKKQASGSSKTEDNTEVTESEVDDSDSKLVSLDLEKKAKSRKLVAVELHEIFKTAFRPRSFGGRRKRRGGHAEQGGFSDWTNYDGPRTNGDVAARAPACIPTEKDFPVLGANPTVATPTVKSST